MPFLQFRDYTKVLVFEHHFVHIWVGLVYGRGSLRKSNRGSDQSKCHSSSSTDHCEASMDRAVSAPSHALKREALTVGLVTLGERVRAAEGPWARHAHRLDWRFRPLSPRLRWLMVTSRSRAFEGAAQAQPMEARNCRELAEASNRRR